MIVLPYVFRAAFVLSVTQMVAVRVLGPRVSFLRTAFYLRVAT